MSVRRRCGAAVRSNADPSHGRCLLPHCQGGELPLFSNRAPTGPAGGMAIGEIPAGRSVRGRRDSLVRWATVLPVAGMLVLAASAQLLHGLNADLSWLLTVTERMLLGQRLYVDIYELNPPMSAL